MFQTMLEEPRSLSGSCETRQSSERLQDWDEVYSSIEDADDGGSQECNPVRGRERSVEWHGPLSGASTRYCGVVGSPRRELGSFTFPGPHCNWNQRGP